MDEAVVIEELLVPNMDAIVQRTVPSRRHHVAEAAVLQELEHVLAEEPPAHDQDLVLHADLFEAGVDGGDVAHAA